MSRRSSNRVNARVAASQISPVGVDGPGINAAALGPPNTVAADDVPPKTEPGLVDYAPYLTQHMTSSPTRNGPGIHTLPQAYIRVDDMRSRAMPKDVKSSALSMSDHVNDEGEEPMFRELLSADHANVGDGFANSSPSSYLPHQQLISWRDYQHVKLPKVIKLPPPQPNRSALYEVGAAFFPHSSPEDTPQPPEPPTMTVQPLDHDSRQSYSPFGTDPTHTAVQFDPSELPPEQRNPNGINWIVQSVEHGYALMRHLKERGQQHHPDNPSSGAPPIDANNGATDKSANDTASEVRSAGPYSTMVDPGSMENTTPNGWNPNVDSSSGQWPTRDSPVRSSVSQGWHMSPQAQIKETGGMQPPASATRPYFPPTGWSQSPVTSTPASQTDKAPPRPSSIPPESREGSWPQQGEVRPPSSTGMRWGTHPQGPPAPPTSGTAPNPQQQQWPSMRSIANPSAPTLPYHPHPDIDGPADDDTRWMSNSAVHSLGRGSRGPGPTNESAPSAQTHAGYSAGGDPSVGSRAPPPPQQSPTAWSPARGAKAPWFTEGGHPLAPDGRLPPDAMLRTPSTQPTAAPGQQQQHATYTGIPMPYLPHGGQQQQQQQQQHQQQSQQLQQPPQPSSGMGREMQYGPQPDSLGGYQSQAVQRAHSVPAGMAHQQQMRYPLSAHSGPGGPGSQVAGMESRNPYPPVPPVAGAVSYGAGPPQPGTTGIPQQSRSAHPLHAQQGAYHPGPQYVTTQTTGGGGPPPPGGDPASAVGGPRVGASPYGQPGWPSTSVAYMINPAQQHAGAATPGPTRPPSVGMHPSGQYITTMGAHPSVQASQDMYAQLQYRGHAPQ